MLRRSTPLAFAVPAIKPLRVNDLLFINEYLKPSIQLDGTAAYRLLHPAVKYETAASQACRLLKKPQVVAELARRMAAAGVSKTWGEARLREYEYMAYARQDYVAGASICMDAMKLAGFLVEKREVLTLTPEDASRVRALVQASLRSPESLPHPSPVVLLDAAGDADRRS